MRRDIVEHGERKLRQLSTPACYAEPARVEAACAYARALYRSAYRGTHRSLDGEKGLIVGIANEQQHRPWLRQACSETLQRNARVTNVERESGALCSAPLGEQRRQSDIVALMMSRSRRAGRAALGRIRSVGQQLGTRRTACRERLDREYEKSRRMMVVPTIAALATRFCGTLTKAGQL